MNSTALPKDFASWLNRPAPRPKAKKRIKPVSPKRQREGREYTKKRRAFLARHTECEAWRIIIQHFWAEQATRGTPFPFSGTPAFAPPPTEIHHRAKRGNNYLNETTWLAVCRWSHNWIHSHPSAARTLGLLA